METNYDVSRRFVWLLVILTVLFAISCTSMPKATVEELALQGIEVGSIKEVIELINSGLLKPSKIEITEGILDPPFYQNFNMKHTKTLGNAFKVSDVKVGKENDGFLRREDPWITFPIEDDSIETDQITTAWDIWQFEGKEGQTIDLMVRSLSTFPVGMFVPYFLLIQEDGRILARQEHILTLAKEKIKGLSIMIWIKNYILPKTGKYYVMVFADNWNENDPSTFDPSIRLNSNRVHLRTAFQSEGWIMYRSGDHFDPEWNEKPMPNLYYEPELLFGRKGDFTQGKYHIILWSSTE